MGETARREDGYRLGVQEEHVARSRLELAARLMNSRWINLEQWTSS